MTHRNMNSIVVPSEEPAAGEHLGFSLLSLPSKYPPVVRSQRKQPLRLFREPRHRFPSRGGAKFALHSAIRSATGDDDRRDAAI